MGGGGRGGRGEGGRMKLKNDGCLSYILLLPTRFFLLSMGLRDWCPCIYHSVWFPRFFL